LSAVTWWRSIIRSIAGFHFSFGFFEFPAFFFSFQSKGMRVKSILLMIAVVSLICIICPLVNRYNLHTEYTKAT